MVTTTMFSPGHHAQPLESQEKCYKREFGISDTPIKLNRQLEKVAVSFGNNIDI